MLSKNGPVGEDGAGRTPAGKHRMNSMKVLAVAAGLAGLAACSSNTVENNADANASLAT